MCTDLIITLLSFQIASLMARGYFPREKDSNSGLQKISPEGDSKTLTDTSNMSATRSALTLPLQHMAIPIYTAPPSREDVEVGGRVIFQNFIHEEMIHQGLPEDAIEIENPPPDVFGDAGPDLYSVPERAVSPALLGLVFLNAYKKLVHEMFLVLCLLLLSIACSI